VAPEVLSELPLLFLKPGSILCTGPVTNWVVSGSTFHSLLFVLFLFLVPIHRLYPLLSRMRSRWIRSPSTCR
jgi:hypothetical protein